MEVFSQEKIAEQLKEVSSHWTYDEGFLHYQRTYKNFKTAILFLNKIAVLADELEHHPQIINSYNALHLRLRTNDFNGITLLDFKMAKAIDALE